jgi:ABC-2 type transport system permease protein
VKAFGYLLTANMRELIRDRMAIFWFFAFPVLFIIMFGTIFARNGDNQSFKVGMVLEEQGVGKTFYKAFASVPTFKLHRGDRNGELNALKKGEREMVVVVPLQASLVHKPVNVLIYYDDSRQLTNNVLLPAAQQIISEVERGLSDRPRLVSIQRQAVQAHKLKQIDYLLPGILAMVLMQLGLFGAMRLVNLRERKILKRTGQRRTNWSPAASGPTPSTRCST